MRNRRAFLQTVGATTLGISASACLEKQDTSSETPESIPSADDRETETHGSPAVSEEGKSRTIAVDTAPFSDNSHFTEYSYSKAEVTINTESIRFYNPDYDYDSNQVIEIIGQQFPEGDVVAEGQSEPFNIEQGESRSLIVPINYRTPSVDEKVHYIKYIRNEDSFFVPVDGTLLSDAIHLANTDPFTITQHGIERYQSEYSQPTEEFSDETDIQTGGYTRENVEGGYRLQFRPLGVPSGLPVPIYIPKPWYYRRKKEERPRTPEPPEDRIKYVEEAIDSGVAPLIAQILQVAAIRNGMTEGYEQLAFAISFVQSLPYRQDRVSTGYRDYSRYIEETLVDAGGDCIDTTILLSSVLQSPPFNHATAYLYSPGHIAVGVKVPNNATVPTLTHQGDHYAYLETTGHGWKVGEIPSDIGENEITVLPL